MSLLNMIALSSVASLTNFHDYIHNIYNNKYADKNLFGLMTVKSKHTIIMT